MSDLDLFSGGGELGALMRERDWAKSPLGPVHTWPHALTTCVRIILTSRQPMFVWWGDQLINLYNDAYKAIVGGKHPEALGQPASVVWREIWDQVGPRAARAMSRQEGTYDEALLLIMERYGYKEETYYTFSYSPVPDEKGGVGGILCANTADTGRIIGERQLGTLREVAATTADARTAGEACASAARALATNPHDLPFALIYLVEPVHRTLDCCGASGIERGGPAAPRSVPLDGPSPWPFEAALRENRMQEVELAPLGLGPLLRGAWDDEPQRAVVLPIAPAGETGRPAVLVAGLNPYRLLDDGYRGFLGLAAGQIGAAIAHAHAYEEERRRAEALAELDRAKTTFFSNVSHEFRTPLTLLLGPTEDALRDPATSPANRERAAIVHRNGLRLLKLVNTLLDFSRIEAGRFDAVFEPTDLAALTAELASTFRAGMERAGLTLAVDCPPLAEPAYVDREMWEKIVLNLLSNAFKFTLAGSVTVGVRRESDGFVLTVADTGVGIAPEDLPQIFQRFHRAERQRGRTQEGTGIGLALVAELARLHGGDVRVESVPDRGSTFTVTIPAGRDHLPADRVSAAHALGSTALGAAPFVEEALRWGGADTVPDDEGTEPRRSAGAGGTTRPDAPVPPPRRSGPTDAPRVLLADDNADMRDYVARLLSTEWRVTAVGDGQAALEAALAEPPALVLSDVMMPRLDGFGLLAALRADPRTATIPIILLSARAGEESVHEGLESGADDYLTKPFTARELQARVRTHIEMARARADAAARERAALQQLDFTLAATHTVAWEWEPERGMAAYYGDVRSVMGIEPGRVAEVEGWGLVHPDDRARVRAATDTAFAGSGPLEVEFRLVHPGTAVVRWVHCNGVVQQDGGQRRMVGVLRDVTERRIAQEAAQAAQRLESLGRLAGGVAHEVNNALTGVLGFAHFLERQFAEGDARRDDLRQIISSGNRAATIVQQLLAYSRRQLLQPRRFDLAELVRGFAPMLRQALGPERSVEIAPATPVRVDADPSQLEQVLLNLALNARDATAPGGHFRVAVAEEKTVVPRPLGAGRGDLPPGRWAVLRAADDGVGMGEEILGRLFEPFFTTKQVGEGTGLGLATVYGIVKQSGGDVGVESAPGRGSTFRVYLPLAPAPDSDRPTPVPGAAPRGSGETIVVVDDMPGVLDFLERLFLEQGYRVVTAPAAGEALARIAELGGRADAVVSDVAMPGMPIADFARRLAEEYPALPVLFISGYGDEEVASRGLGRPDFAFEPKPLDPDRLLGRVRELIERRRRAARDARA